MQRLGVCLTSSVFTIMGAVMATQWVYDRADVGPSFAVLALVLLFGGIGAGALTVKKE